MRQVHARFNGRDDFSWTEVLDLVHAEPDQLHVDGLPVAQFQQGRH